MIFISPKKWPSKAIQILASWLQPLLLSPTWPPGRHVSLKGWLRDSPVLSQRACNPNNQNRGEKAGFPTFSLFSPEHSKHRYTWDACINPTYYLLLSQPSEMKYTQYTTGGCSRTRSHHAPPLLPSGSWSLSSPVSLVPASSLHCRWNNHVRSRQKPILTSLIKFTSITYLNDTSWAETQLRICNIGSCTNMEQNKQIIHNLTKQRFHSTCLF